MEEILYSVRNRLSEAQPFSQGDYLILPFFAAKQFLVTMEQSDNCWAVPSKKINDTQGVIEINPWGVRRRRVL